MSRIDRSHTRRLLAKELQTASSVRQLESIGRQFPALGDFDAWHQVVELLLDRSVPDKRKDGILRAVIHSLQQGTTPACSAALLVAFWPALSTIALKRRDWNNDDDELWHILEWAFLETIHQFDLVDASPNMAGRIVRSTAECTRRVCRREVSFQRRSVKPASGNDRDSLLLSVVDPRRSDAKTQERIALAKRRITRARGAGLLSDDDLSLLMEIDYDGDSIADAAQRRGQDYETIKKRRQRLLARLRD